MAEVAGVATGATPVLRAHSLSKRYGAHLALDGVSLDFMPGQAHVLFGENGAGKSTLIGLLAGARVPSAGHVEMAGFSGTFTSVAQARAAGVRAVFQEFSLVPQLSVAENVLLGEEPIAGVAAWGWLNQRAGREQVRQLIAELGFELDADTRVAELPRGKQQMVEIIKALRRRPKLLILDEPTASLSEHDAVSLFTLVRRLKAQGTAIVYITHRMHEIALIGEQVSVLRDGRLVGTVPATTPAAQLIGLMTGRTPGAHLYPEPGPTSGPVRLALQGVSLAPRPGAAPVHDVTLQVRGGEIVGLAGLVGCGKSELAQACFGLGRVVAGHMHIDGQPVRLRHPADAIGKGLWYSPADRKADGLALGRPARENVLLSALRHGAHAGAWPRPAHERQQMALVSTQVEFAAERAEEPVANFSGGNQQKLLLAKGLVQHIGVYVFDEPTVGVDVGARQAIYRCLVQLSAAGAAIVVASSDLAELMGITHRLLVMQGGRIVAELARAEYDERRILAQFF